MKPCKLLASTAACVNAFHPIWNPSHYGCPRKKKKRKKFYCYLETLASCAKGHKALNILLQGISLRIAQISTVLNRYSQHLLLESRPSYYRAYCECKLKIMHDTQPNPNEPMAQCQIHQEQRLLILLLKHYIKNNLLLTEQNNCSSLNCNPDWDLIWACKQTKCQS